MPETSQVTPMNRRGLSLAGVASLMLLVVACGHPGDTAVKYLKAKQNQDQGAWDMLCKTDQAFMPKEKLVSDQGEFAAVAKTMASKTSFRLLSEDVNGNTATAKVEVKSPNPMAVVGVMFKAAMSHEGDKDTAKAMQKAADGDTDLVTKTVVVTLVKEGGSWKVKEDFADAEKAGLLLKSATQAKDESDLERASTLTDQALAIRPNDQDGIALRSSIDKDLPAYREGLAYIPKLEIINLKVKNASGFFGELKGAEGEIKNNGDKTLGRAEGRITYFDASGKPCFDHSFLMFDGATTGMMSTHWTDLKPNCSERFLAFPDDVPSSWDGKTVKVEVISIKLKP